MGDDQKEEERIYIIDGNDVIDNNMVNDNHNGGDNHIEINNNDNNTKVETKKFTLPSPKKANNDDT